MLSMTSNLAIGNGQGERVLSLLHDLSPVTHIDRLEGAEGFKVAGDLIVFVNENDFVALRCIEPVVAGKAGTSQLAACTVIESHGEQTDQWSKPSGGFLLYLRLYSSTASSSVVLCRLMRFLHFFSACSMSARIGCRPFGLTRRRPFGWKVCDEDAEASEGDIESASALADASPGLDGFQKRLRGDARADAAA